MDSVMEIVTAAAEDQIEVFGKMLQEKFDTRRIGMIVQQNILTKNWKCCTDLSE